MNLQNSGAVCREKADSYLPVIARSEATKQSSPSLAALDCLASLAMTMKSNAARRLPAAVRLAGVAGR
jgi:hypothetical protein